jgi:hypothetical protein
MKLRMVIAILLIASLAACDWGDTPDPVQPTATAIAIEPSVTANVRPQVPPSLGATATPVPSGKSVAPPYHEIYDLRHQLFARERELVEQEQFAPEYEKVTEYFRALLGKQALHWRGWAGCIVPYKNGSGIDATVFMHDPNNKPSDEWLPTYQLPGVRLNNAKGAQIASLSAGDEIVFSGTITDLGGYGNDEVPQNLSLTNISLEDVTIEQVIPRTFTPSTVDTSAVTIVQEWKPAFYTGRGSRLTVRGDGTAEYWSAEAESWPNDLVPGTRREARKQLDPLAIQRLVSEFDRADVLSLKDKYDDGGDVPYLVISIETPSYRKEIIQNTHSSVPSRLLMLQCVFRNLSWQLQLHAETK